jgi:hypothetical protein
MSAPDLPLRYELEVPASGRVEVPVPFPPGAHVTLYVLEQADREHDDLRIASRSSTDFWDNPLDDEDWNHA